MRALHGDRPVAGICVGRHGTAATYLLGWNGEEGRVLRAHQFLLWQAMVKLKESGCRWLDLGGINEEGTPSIAAFKNGVNGLRYELVGEYVRF
jgi:lipid II:glycine glycyltransferase (peptidoglycan interpeptide bridge formation enzyme)